MDIKQVAPDAAIAELPVKLKSERRISRELRSIFNDMGDFAITEIGISGIVPHLDGFNEDMTSLLRKDARVTSKSFRSMLRKRLNLGNIESARINAEIDFFIFQTVQKQSNFIINTTNNIIDKTARQVVGEFAELGIDLNNDDLSKQVGLRFKDANRNRVGTIAQVEVQRISERSKLVEVDILQRSGNIKESNKRWDAILDIVTRSFHASADAQIVPVSSPFEVLGESLMHPGDASLGATAKNLINCRCSMQILVD